MKYGIFVVSCLALAACSNGSSGSAFCSDYFNLTNQEKPCIPDGGSSSAPDGGTVFTQDMCNTDYNSAACSAADRSALDSSGACVAALGNCNPADPLTFETNLVACILGDGGTGGINAVSSSCRAQFGTALGTGQ